MEKGRPPARLRGGGQDLLVAGQTPIGELLASPSTVRVGALAACLLDCDDQTRAARIEARGAGWFDRAGGTMHDYLAWGRWMRKHADDPTYRLGVIRAAGDALEWGRLERTSALARARDRHSPPCRLDTCRGRAVGRR
jgi:chorismate-pyruvate lyase